MKVGDKIMFEVSTKGNKNLPRWLDNSDNGGDDKWATGTVVAVDPEKFEVNYTIFGFVGVGSCYFPNIENQSYKKDQWNYPGYLKNCRCECGSEKLNYYNHSSWCIVETYNRRKETGV